MKKIILSTALVSTVLFGSIQVASAAEVKNAETPVGIEFEKIGPDVEGPYKGVLTLVFKPSALEFGKYKASGAQITAGAKNIGGTQEKQWLVVNDDRDYMDAPTTNDAADVKGGTWKLTAKMSELTSESIKDSKLPATLNMNFDTPKAYNMGTNPTTDGLDYIPNKPNEKDENNQNVISEAALPESQKIRVTSAVSLVAGSTDEIEVMKKAEGTSDKVGVATELTSANLIVQPTKGYQGGKLTSKVTWTLSTGL